jgi:hypothetical protein
MVQMNADHIGIHLLSGILRPIRLLVALCGNSLYAAPKTAPDCWMSLSEENALVLPAPGGLSSSPLAMER